MERIHKHRDTPDQCWVLRQGKVAFGIKEGETYPIEGVNMIVAAEEFILGWGAPGLQFRLYDFYKERDAVLIPVQPERLRELLPKYTVGFALNQHLARMALVTANILRERRSVDKSADVETYNANAKKYYFAVTELGEIADKFRFPPILQLVEKLKNELIYEAGRIHAVPEKTLFDVATQKGGVASVPGNTVLCEQGTEGDELFILNRGTLDVFVKGAKVASLSEAGSVIGEIALFLGEHRTATLRTAGACEITRLKRDNLKAFVEGNPIFFETIAASVSKRIRNTFVLIRDFDKKNQPHPGKIEIPAFLLGKPGEDKLAHLFRELHNIQRFKRFEQLKPFIEKHKADYQHFNELK
ncbi:MAG: cyclic nucleotide-binding domain-containing protein [Spirochaetes bacterium]|nr:cyclic nucleotide-binding domain-containing protein [Spirochaetota bacterium]